jgi:hypothetical protein
MLETDRYETIREIANTEKINPSDISRVLRLKLLARVAATPAFASLRKGTPLNLGNTPTRMVVLRRGSPVQQ